MNALEYCAMVEESFRIHQELSSSVSIKEDNSGMVSLKESGFKLIFEPSVMAEYRYLVREGVFEKLGRISKRLEREDKILIIRSVWRSFAHQRLLWTNTLDSLRREFPDKSQSELEETVSHYFAEEGKSLHSTGGAVDALIFDVPEDRVMDFGTNDGLKINLNNKCYPYHPDIAPHAKANRKLLIDLFEEEDFVVHKKEYWHFDFGNVSWAVDRKKSHAIFGIIKQFP